jgi:hypothetical protein
MSITAASSGAVNSRPATDTRVLLIIIWCAITAEYLIAGWGRDGALSTDDAMRLVEVRDFLAGQGWFDFTQYRLNPPDGVVMHWSRLIDLPLATLIRAAETVLPTGWAERLVVTVWPIALLLIFLAGVARLARDLADETAARLALILAALSAPVLQHFRPGAIDHHNVQLVLLIWSLVHACRVPARPRDAGAAAALSAGSLAVGMEMTPAIVALAAVTALRWIAQGAAAAPIAQAFGIVFAAAMFALFAATVSPLHYATSACDALSAVHLMAACIGGIGLAALASLHVLRSSIGRRLTGAGVLAVVLATALAVAYPACLGDPFEHLDSRLSTLWLSHVNEARSIASMLRDLPQEVLPYYGLPLAALVLSSLQIAREAADARWSWICGAAVLGSLFLLALWLVRGATAANAVAVALVAAALVRMLPPRKALTYFGLSRAALAVALLLNPLAMLAIGAAIARGVTGVTNNHRLVASSERPETCQRASDYLPLAGLPKGLVLGFIDAGPFLLMQTPHTVLAAPYHRDIVGNTTMLDIFLAPLDEAQRRINDARIDYVAFCPGSPERYNYSTAAPEGLAAALGRGEVPDFLIPVPLDGHNLAVYRAKD